MQYISKNVQHTHKTNVTSKASPVKTSPAVALFLESYESLIKRCADLKHQNLQADTIEKQLIEIADQTIQDYNISADTKGTHYLNKDYQEEFKSYVRGIINGGTLAPLLDRSDVASIHIFGHDTIVLSLTDGSRTLMPSLADTEEHLAIMIHQLAAKSGHTSLRFNATSPVLNIRLESGHYLFAVTSITEQISAVIHRPNTNHTSLEVLEQTGAITPQISYVLKSAVQSPSPANLLIVGGTGTGKTTLLRSLLAEIPQSEFLVTVENNPELNLKTSAIHQRTLALTTSTTNNNTDDNTSMDQLVDIALNMSADRLIIDEVQDTEAVHLLKAMGTGNDGSIGTINAYNINSAINKILIYTQRLAAAPTPDSVIREISEVLHLLICTKKLSNGCRVVTSIQEITGYKDGEVTTSEVFAPGTGGIATYVKPFNSSGQTLACLTASGFNPEKLGTPYQTVPSGYYRPQANHPTRQDTSTSQINQSQPQPAHTGTQVHSAYTQHSQPQPNPSQPQPNLSQPQQPQPNTSASMRKNLLKKRRSAKQSRAVKKQRNAEYEIHAGWPPPNTTRLRKPQDLAAGDWSAAWSTAVRPEPYQNYTNPSVKPPWESTSPTPRAPSHDRPWT